MELNSHSGNIVYHIGASVKVQDSDQPQRSEAKPVIPQCWRSKAKPGGSTVLKVDEAERSERGGAE